MFCCFLLEISTVNEFYLCFIRNFEMHLAMLRTLSPEEFLLLYKQHYLARLLFYFLFFLVLHWQCRQQHHEEK